MTSEGTGSVVADVQVNPTTQVINVVYTDDVSGQITPITYSFPDANLRGAILAWESGFAGFTPPPSTGQEINTGDLLVAHDTRANAFSSFIYTGTDAFIFGDDSGAPGASDFVQISSDQFPRLEAEIAAISFDTLAAKAGIHLATEGPEGNELVRTSNEATDIVLAYWQPDENRLSIELRPDVAVLNAGVWELVTGSAAIAEFPDANGNPPVAGFGQEVTDLMNPPATVWSGNIQLTHYDGRNFFLVFNVTDGQDYLNTNSDGTDQRQDITGQNIIDVFRNVYSVGSTQASGFLFRGTDGAYSFSSSTSVQTGDIFTFSEDGATLNAFASRWAASDTTDLTDTQGGSISVGQRINRGDLLAVEDTTTGTTTLYLYGGPSTVFGNRLDNTDFGVVPAGSGGFPDIPNTNAGTHYIRSRVTDAMTAETVSDWTAVDLDNLENRNDITFSSDSIDTDTLLRDATVVLDVSLSADPLDLRYAASPTFTVDPSRWEIYDGEYIKFTYYAIEDEMGDPLDPPVVIPFAYFVGQVVGFVRNNNNQPILAADINIGTTDLAAEHMRLEIQNLAVTPSLQGLIDASGGTLDRWFITPANSLDALGIRRGAAAEVVDYTWLGAISGEVGHLGYTADANQFILQQDSTSGRQDWITLQSALPRHPVTNVSSNVPVNQTLVDSTDTYEISYTLENDVNRIQVIIDGLTVHTVNSPNDLLNTGDRTISFVLTDTERDNIRRTGESVYNGNRYQLVVTFTDGTIHRYSVRAGTTGITTDDIHVIGGEVDGNALVLHSQGQPDIRIPGVGYQWDVGSTIPITSTGITTDILSEDGMTVVTEWQDREWSVTVTHPEQITGGDLPLVLEYHGFTHSLTTGTVEPGTATYTFTFRDFAGTIDNIEGFAAGTPTYGTEPDNLRVRTANYSEVHFAHFEGGSLHPTADHYVIGGRATDFTLGLDIKGLGQNAVTIPGVPEVTGAEGTTANEVVDQGIPVFSIGDPTPRDILHLESPTQLGDFRGAFFTFVDSQTDPLNPATTEHYLISAFPPGVGVESFLFAPEIPAAASLAAGNLTITYKPEITFDQLVNIGEGSDIRFFDQTRLSSGIISVQVVDGLAEQIIQPGGIAVVNPTTQYYNISRERQLIQRGRPVNEFPADGISTAVWSRVGDGSTSQSFVPVTFTSSPFNFAYTLDQYNTVFNEDVLPINNEVNSEGVTVAVPVTRTGVDLILAEGDTSLNAGENPEIVTALNDYLNDASRIGISQEEQIAIINGGDRVQTRTVSGTPASAVFTYPSGLGNGVNGFLSTQEGAVTVTRGGTEVPATVTLDPSGGDSNTPGIAVVTLVDGSNFQDSDEIEVTLLGTGFGALVEFTTTEGSVTFYVRQAATSGNWEWLQGGIPQDVPPTSVDLTINYFDRLIPTFNDVNRVPFALTGTETEITNAISDIENAEVLEFSTDNFTTVSTVTTHGPIRQDAFGQYYSLEFSSPLGNDFQYNPANDVTLSLRTAQADQRIESGSISGAVSQDGTPAYVPGALYRETGFDENDVHIDVQPIDFDGDNLHVKIVGKNGDGAYDQISVPIPELANLSNRVAHLEQGGGGTGDTVTYTPRAFKMFPSPWIMNSGGDYHDLFANLRLGWEAGIPNASIVVGGDSRATAINATVHRHRADFLYRADGFRQTYGHDFSYTFNAGDTTIQPATDLYRALELAYLGQGASTVITTQAYDNNSAFRTAGFLTSGVQTDANGRRDVTYQQNGEYRTDVLVNFGAFEGSINHDFTLGLTRVSGVLGGPAIRYDIRNGAIPNDIHLNSAVQVLMAWFFKTPREGSQLSGVRTETLTAHGTYNVGVDATNRHPNFRSNTAQGNELRFYTLTAAQRLQIVGTRAADTSFIDGWNAGGLEDVRTLVLSGRFRQGQNFTNNNGSQTFSYLVSTNTEGSSVTQAANATGFATGSLNWLAVTIPDDDSTDDAGLDWPNIDTIGFNPVTLREVWSSGGTASAVDLHTLSSDRTPIMELYPNPIHNSWLTPETLSTPVIQLAAAPMAILPGQIARGENDFEWFINRGTTTVNTTLAGAEGGSLSPLQTTSTFNGGTVNGDVTFSGNTVNFENRDINIARRQLSGGNPTASTVGDGTFAQSKTIDDQTDIQVGDFFVHDGVTYTIVGLPENSIQFRPRTSPVGDGTFNIDIQRNTAAVIDFNNADVRNLPGLTGVDLAEDNIWTGSNAFNAPNTHFDSIYVQNDSNLTGTTRIGILTPEQHRAVLQVFTQDLTVDTDLNDNNPGDGEVFLFNDGPGTLEIPGDPWADVDLIGLRNDDIVDNPVEGDQIMIYADDNNWGTYTITAIGSPTGISTLVRVVPVADEFRGTIQSPAMILSSTAPIGYARTIEATQVTRDAAQLTFGGIDYTGGEFLALNIDTFGTITSQDIPGGITFASGGTDLTGVTSVLSVTHKGLNYFLVYTRVGSANTQYFYRENDTAVPFHTVQITT